jgi:hypothetical protein
MDTGVDDKNNYFKQFGMTSLNRKEYVAIRVRRFRFLLTLSPFRTLRKMSEETRVRRFRLNFFCSKQMISALIVPVSNQNENERCTCGDGY